MSDFIQGTGLGALLIAVAFGVAKLSMLARTKAMRSLALKWGFEFEAGDQRLLALKDSDCPIPGFHIRRYPVTDISRIFNIIDGQKDGVRIVIFDSVLNHGGPKGGTLACTFVATQTADDLFTDSLGQRIAKSKRWSAEKVFQSSGWTVLYRFRYLQVPGTLNIRRLEELLTNMRQVAPSAASG